MEFHSVKMQILYLFNMQLTECGEHLYEPDITVNIFKLVNTII